MEDELNVHQRLHLLDLLRQLRERAAQRREDDRTEHGEARQTRDEHGQYALLPSPTVVQGARRTHNP